MGVFATIMETMAGMDLFQLFFPWLLVFSISYGILTNSEVVTDDESVNGTIALALAFIAVGGAFFFIPGQMFAHFGAALSFGVLGIVGLVVMLGVAGYDLEQLSESKSEPTVAVAILVFIVAFLGVLSFRFPVMEMITAVTGSGADLVEDVLMPIIVLLFLLGVVYVSTQGGD